MRITGNGGDVLSTITQDIKEKKFQKTYLIYGEEKYLVLQYKRELLRALVPEDDTMNFTRFSGKDADPAEIIGLCETLPFFAERRVLLIEDSGFFKNKCDELADYMKNLPETVCLIFVEDQVDKRSRMYKAVKSTGSITECTTPDDQRLMQWVGVLLKKNGKRISVRDCGYLLKKTGTDMGNLRMEMEKLIGYTEGRETVTTADIDAVCTTAVSSHIFDMVRAVAEKDQRRAMDLYLELLALKEPPMRILFLLARQFRQLLQIREMEEEGRGRQEIQQILGIPGFAVRQSSACARAYSPEKLSEAVRDFVDYEEAVKTGILSDRLSVELLIMKYSGNVPSAGA